MFGVEAGRQNQPPCSLMAELSKGDELALRESNGDASATIVPSMRLSCVNPYLPGEELSKVTCETYYFFPAGSYWSESARGFGQVRGSLIPNSSLNSELMLHHVFDLAHKMGDSLEESLPRQVVTWTNVPHKDDSNCSAGFLVRCSYQTDASNVHKAHKAQLESSVSRAIKASEGNNIKFFNPRFTPAFQRLTYDAWVNMCTFYLKRAPGQREQGFQDLDVTDNPYNAFSVFSLENACNKMRRANAAAQFTLPPNWRTADGAVVFPDDGTFTYKLAPSQLNCVHIRKLYLPHAGGSVVNREATAEWLGYLQDVGMLPNGDLASEEEDEDGLSNEDRLLQAQRNYDSMATCTDADEGNTLISFKKRVTKRMATARALANGDPALEAINRREAQLELLRVFEKEIFTEDETADVGDAIHALAKWKNEYLRENNNFCMPTAKRTSNLTRFGEWQTYDANLSETTFDINTAHQEVKSVWLACMHVYFYSPFHVHTCLAGPPGSGKSNTFHLNEKKLVPGTIRDVGSESAKAKMTPGKKTDLSIETFEDINPSHMGVASTQSFSSGATTSNTDAEAMLKYRLTKGRVKGVYKMVKDGVHSMVEVDSFCNTVMLVGMNAALNQVPKAISDRFNNIHFQVRTRTGFNGGETSMFLKYQQADDRAGDRLKHDAYKRFHRNQLFHAMIELLIWAGVLAQVEMTVPVLIASHTMSKAHEKGLQETTNVRHFERLKFHCETLVIEDAIDRVLDSKLSPINRGRDSIFRITDLVEFEKHFVGGSEHVSFGFGLLEHQWENTITLAVKKWLKMVLLKDLIRMGAAGVGKYDINDNTTEINSYYYHVKFDHSLQSSSIDRERFLQTHEMLKRLAKVAHKQMDPSRLLWRWNKHWAHCSRISWMSLTKLARAKSVSCLRLHFHVKAISWWQSISSSITTRRCSRAAYARCSAMSSLHARICCMAVQMSGCPSYGV